MKSLLSCFFGLVLLLLGSNVAAQPVLSGAQTTLIPLAHYQSSPPGPLSRTVSVRARQMPLPDLLREIARQAQLVVVFNTDLVATRAPRTLTLQDVTAVEAFQRALHGTGLASYLQPDRKILILEAPEPSLPTGPASIADGQTVRGRVVDRDSQVPLPGANVVVLETEPLRGTTTDAGGNFAIENVPLGRHRIQVSFIGFEPVILPNVLVTSGKETVLHIALREQVLASEEIVVRPEVRKDQPLNAMAVVSARSFSVEETRRYAGGLDDPARMASAFAGITGTSVENNALIIRGNAPKGVLWRLEGVDIPNPNHFGNIDVIGGGGVTLFSSQLLANSDIFTGAFPAEYGNALSGVFDMNLRSGNPTRREHAVQVGVIGIDVASEGPFVEGTQASYLFNYRYSTLGLIMPLLPVDDVIKYQDLSFKLTFPMQRLGRFDVWGLGGLDHQRAPVQRDSSDWKYETDRYQYGLDLGLGASGISHTLLLGGRGYLKSTLASSVYRIRYEERRLDDALVLQDDTSIESTNGRLIFSSFLNYKFSARHVNRTGFAAQQLFYDFAIGATPRDTPPLQTIALGDGSSTLLQVYTQSQFELHPRLSLHAGIHTQYFRLTGQYTVEPRAGVRWQLGDGQALSLGYGLHSQIEDLRIYFAQQATPGGTQMPNRDLGVARAHHGVLGYDHRLGDAARLKLEAYYQHLFDVPVISDSSYSLLNFEQNWEFIDALVNEGAGRNYGLEATLERFLQDGYYYLLTGSVFSSRYRGGDGIWRRSRFDRTFTINGLAGKEVALGDRNNLLGFNIRLAFQGGKRYSPLDPVASVERGEIVLDESLPFAEQEPSQFFLDVTLTYRRNHNRYAEVWAIQVKNALGAKNFYWDYRYETGAYEEIYESIVLPMLSYKIEF